MVQGYEVLQFLIPSGGWSIIGDDFDGITFHEAEPITKSQFEAGFALVEAAKAEADQAKAAAKASAEAKLATLGLTADEVAALLG